MYQIFQILAPLIVLFTGIMEIILAVMESKREKEERAKTEAQRERDEIKEKWKKLINSGES